MICVVKPCRLCETPTLFNIVEDSENGCCSKCEEIAKYCRENKIPEGPDDSLRVST